MSSQIKEAQLNMQQKLGRCMLRLQQYERLLKAMVGSMAVEGELDQFNAARDRKLANVQDKSLGTLVKMFTNSHLIPAPTLETEPIGDRFGGPSAEVASARIHFSVSMSPEVHAQTIQGLAELVALRNNLVHHLIERFDISSEVGCRAASTHLDNCYEKIDGHAQLLKAWAGGLAEVQALASDFAQSKEFENSFVHGANPDAPR